MFLPSCFVFSLLLLLVPVLIFFDAPLFEHSVLNATNIFFLMPETEVSIDFPGTFAGFRCLFSCSKKMFICYLNMSFSFQICQVQCVYSVAVDIQPMFICWTLPRKR